MHIDSSTYRRDLKWGVGNGCAPRPPGISPSSLVIHTTNGAIGSAFEREALWLRDNNQDAPARRVSAHYLVGKTGRIAQIVPDYLEAWHVGVALADFANSRSIGIECHLTPGEAWMPAQRDALTWLVNTLMRTHAIPRAKVETHRAVALPKGRKVDPSEWSDRDFYAWRDRLGVPAAPEPPSADGVYSEHSRLLGVAQATAELAAAYVVRSGRSRYTAYDLRSIASDLWAWCKDGGANADLVWAQTLHETAWLSSWWAQRPRRNPAGIGVTGAVSRARPTVLSRVAEGVVIPTWAKEGMIWKEGISFPSWELATRAQVGRWLLYALPVGAGVASETAALMRYAEAVRPLPVAARGSAQTLRELGKAHNVSGYGWADPGTDYGAKLAAAANALVQEVRNG